MQGVSAARRKKASWRPKIAKSGFFLGERTLVKVIFWLTLHWVFRGESTKARRG